MTVEQANLSDAKRRALVAYLEAVKGSDQDAAALAAGHLAENVNVIGYFGTASGKAAAVTYLKGVEQQEVVPSMGIYLAPTLREGRWEGPFAGKPTLPAEAYVRMEPTLSPPAPVYWLVHILGDRTFYFLFAFDDRDRITDVETGGWLMPPPAQDVIFNQDIKTAIDSAANGQSPFIVAYVDAEGMPRMSFRGTVQACGDDQVGFWVRDPQGGLLTALKANPLLSLFFHDTATHQHIELSGRGRVVTDPALRDRIFDRSILRERNFDLGKRGRAVIVDVDKAFGSIPSQGIFVMKRNAGS